MQTYEPWSPTVNLPKFFECYALDSDSGLELLLHTSDADGRILALRFAGRVPAYARLLRSVGSIYLLECLEGKDSFGWLRTQSGWLNSV